VLALALALAGCRGPALAGVWLGSTDASATDARATDAGADGRDATDASAVTDARDAADRPTLTDAGADGRDATDGPLPPSCVISSPIITATHPALNGVPVAQGGDRASAPGAPYAVTFVVTTSLVDGQTVDLDLSDAATPSIVTTATATASGGKAVFVDVALNSGETYDARARCVAGDGGLTGLSAAQSFPVDATPPDLTVSAPHDGDVIPPSGLTNGAFPVCGSTTSADAVGLAANDANFCASVGGSPTCAAATMTGTDVCVQVPCPGDAAFDITVTLTDSAGNSTTETVTNVSCFSTLPSVSIVVPVSDAPTFSNLSRRLLAADTLQPLHDLSTDPGAQTNVVTCSNRVGSVVLLAGLAGGVLNPIDTAATRVALPADGCPAGLGNVAAFPSATLPESAEASDTSLLAATELRVDFTDLSNTKNSSPVVDLWVDSIDPELFIASPSDICGSTHTTNSNGSYVIPETVTSTAPNVMLDLTNDMSTQTFNSTTFDTTMQFPFVVFTPGTNFQTGSVRDDAGNAAGLTPSPCVVTVGP
ncbi:MAG TPA: hypothetical protein VK989_12425, partial [Polyangia bacterium]|nr:hypothetical protein [Polyangia bacterium]